MGLDFCLLTCFGIGMQTPYFGRETERKIVCSGDG